MYTTNNFTGNQNSFNYALYMMLGSYFKQMEAVSASYVQKLYLYYKENKRERQYDLEDIVIRFAEQTLRKELPEDIWQERMSVSFATKGGQNYIIFDGAQYTLTVACNYRGGRTKLHYRLQEYTPAIER